MSIFKAVLEREGGLGRRHRRCHWNNKGVAQRFHPSRVLEGHEGFVNSICWDQTGELLLSGGDDKRVTIWKPSSHLPKLLSFDSGHKGNIYGARFAPDGDAVIATCSQDNTVKVHKLGPAGTRCTLTLWSHSDFVNAIEMHPRNPKILWSGSSDGSVRCFDLRQKSGYGTWFHESGIASGPCGPWGMQGFSRPDGRVEEWKGGSLLSCEKNVETKSVFAWPSKEEGIFSMSLDPLREQYFVTAGEGKYIRLYDIRKPPKIAPGDVGHVKKVAPAGLKYLSQITGVRYNFDGSKCLASCTGGDIYLVAIRENSQRIRAHQRFGARSSTLLTKPKSKSKSKSKSIASYTHRLRPRKRSREQTDHDPVTRPKQSYRSSYAITSPSVNPKLNPSDQSKSMTPNGHNMTVTTGTSCASMQRALTLGEKVCGSKVEAKHYKEDPGDEKVVLGDETMSTKHDGRDSDSRRRNGKGEQHHRESSLLPQGDHPPTNADNGQNPMHTEQHQQEPGSDLDLDLDQDAEPEPEPESGQGLVDTDNLLLGVRVKRMYEGGLLSLSKRDYRRAIKLLKGAIGLSRNTEPAVSRAGMYMQRSRAKYHLVIDRKARLSERKRRETLSSALRDCERACVLAKGTDLEDEIRFSRARLLFHFGRFKEALAEAKLLLTLPAHKTSVPREAIGDLITSIHMVFKNQPEVVGAGGILSFKFEGNESPVTSDDEDQGHVGTLMTYSGHRNNRTLKGVNFWGPRSEFVVSGSDDRRIFIWDAHTAQIVRVMDCSSDIIDFIEGHPTNPMLASTGERAVTLWEPMDEGFQNWQDIRDRLPSIVATNKNRNATKIRRMVTQSQLRGIMSQQDNNCSIQ